jgi:hypothetical protein
MIKCLNVRCHVGAQIGAKVLTSIDAKKDGYAMSMTKEGVFLTTPEGEPYFIPHGTIASIRLCKEGYAAAMGQADVPRKPGRPKAE